ncbi:hypothetical protein EW026_g6497 [Hermanssonia centrifuga]|uniref:Helicase C-terminal domain-containing protein n=1 Tax=Hermanssonia centrifuga TaxID=98765 RepID=A0A4S4KBU4_9APHY|nr:hypothetical protein EW026_g6497 [Hermanssonia centrifuga]
MAKGKATASTKGQQSITAFFGGDGGSSKPASKHAPAKKIALTAQRATKKSGKKVAEDEDEAIEVEEEDGDDADASSNYEPDQVDEQPPDEDFDPDEVEEEAEDDAPVEEELSDIEPEEVKKPKARSRPTTKISQADIASLPPIHAIPAIFHDLVERAPQIKSVVEHLEGRKMRVATMCSGTESPLLALDLIRRSIVDHYDVNLQFEHVFSCEIEPFKQAYIERNFSPPLLFRDVCELGDGHAYTAYGALAPVPGDVDLLVAGTSCVDYSNLNNEKQGIEANGESGRTFRGMMGWVKIHRPPLVILENVCGAPWKRVQEYFEKIDYSAEFMRVDTKQFYIPHTRTRVYLLAVDSKRSALPKQWMDMIKKMQRPASSTLDAFLLPSDDPRIHQARERLVRESYNAVDRRTGRTDWNRCESRHQRARLEEELGAKRPLTNWEDGGHCKLPDFAWNDWGHGQVERVWDLMDITLLRSAKLGVDPSYKTIVWNLSQNVDRTIGSSKMGICPCLTPSMIPYITNRGGPMVGLEALSMQGLPVDELLLTRETEDQLADLAGNAMSTTVVGACIMAALIVGKKLLREGTDTVTYEEKNHRVELVEGDEGDDEQQVDEVVMDIDKLELGISVEDHVSGENQLLEKPLDLSATSARSLADLLIDAHKSARLYCGSSSCIKCGGRPEHNFKTIDLVTNPRLLPSTFAKELKSTLPMALQLANVSQELLDNLKETSGVDVPKKRWEGWCEAVLRVAKHELRFVEPRRQEIWVATYQSPAARLELLLHPQQPEWRLYALPEESEPSNSELRKLLEAPVGSRYVSRSQWKAVNLFRHGRLSLDCKAKSSRTKKVHSKLEISVGDDDAGLLDRDISGAYVLLDKCGTANSALHKRVPKPEDKHLAPIFLFLDPSRCAPSEEDGFVFSISKRRLEYGEARPLICQVDPKWRQSAMEGTQIVKCTVPCKWVESSEVRLAPAPHRKAFFAVPGKKLDVGISHDSCRSANAVLACRVPLNQQAGPEWEVDKWKEVDKVHERLTFKSLAWLTERVRNDDDFTSWQEVDWSDHHLGCERCAPTPPAIRWTKNAKKRVVAVEDTAQAGEYERALKRRPAPFVTQLKLEQNGVGNVRIGINIASLVHRALSRLPSAGRKEPATVTWRLNTDFTPVAKLNLAKFTLASNRSDTEHAQPPSFKVPLRAEQLRSLTWMLAQEATDATPFVEEEISEAILEPLGWRAEGRAQRPIRVRGGVLADQVGYGKTAITLGLIDCTAKEIRKEFSKIDNMKSKIPVQATLVIVPPHLTRQWASEVKKFTGNRFKVVTLSSASSINALKIEDVQEADIVVVASNLFKSQVYLANLSAFAAGGNLPENQEGRFFDSRLDATLDALGEQVDLIREDLGVERVAEKIRRAGKQSQDEEMLFVQTKRLKGRRYREIAEKGKATQVKILPKPAAETRAQVPRKASTRKHMIVEVVVPYRSTIKSQVSSPASSPPPATTADEDSDVVEEKPRRLSKAVVAISDDDNDDDDDNDEAGLPKATYAKRQESSADEMDIDDAPKKKTGGKIASGSKSKISKARAQASSASETEATDGMDVDEPPSSKGKGKAKATKAPSRKRKSSGESDDDEDQKPPAKKKVRREDGDPWKLGTNPVRKDWTQMRAPPLEMFYFARTVVDEYTYLEGKTHSMVTRLTAQRQWVLSGTPPIADFGALKTISAFLGVHLGIDDDGEGESAKKRKREQTAVERFHSFREVHSLEWHAHRHELGQAFLNRFVRQIEKISLPAAERAIYLELEHHLRALDMTVKRGKKSESDREKRLAQALGDSNSAEEALLKRCSHFDLETNQEENAMKACEVIVRERRKQLDNCKTEFVAQLRKAVKQEKTIGRVDEESPFQHFARLNRTEDPVGDADARTMILGLMDEAKVPPSRTDVKVDQKSAAKGKGKAKASDLTATEKAKEDAKWEHREHTHEIRRLQKELVGRVRSLRYFTVVRDLQKQNDTPPVVACPSCGRDEVPIEEIAVLSSCGHMGCYKCVEECADREECVYTASGVCKAAARKLNIVRGNTLGVDDVARDGKGRHFGMKLEKVIELIKKRIPKDERALIFVQFPDLMKKVAEALEANKIKFLEIKGSASQKSKNLEKYQNDSEERVLLLNVMDESASGANLTGANHAIFLSPLLAPSKEIYKACETQAIGRVQRYGQNKHVKIWRFLSLNTIDVEIYEDRTGEKVTVES